MTPAERREPHLIKASRRRRIAAGSGTTVADVNRSCASSRRCRSSSASSVEPPGPGTTWLAASAPGALIALQLALSCRSVRPPRQPLMAARRTALDSH